MIKVTAKNYKDAKTAEELSFIINEAFAGIAEDLFIRSHRDILLFGDVTDETKDWAYKELGIDNGVSWE